MTKALKLKHKEKLKKMNEELTKTILAHEETQKKLSELTEQLQNNKSKRNDKKKKKTKKYDSSSDSQDSSDDEDGNILFSFINFSFVSVEKQESGKTY